MSTIPSPGRTPRSRIQLFHIGTNHTDKYGPIEVDHADLIQVMHEHERRGRLLAIDVEHATQEPAGKPASWQEAHGWAGLEADAQGLHSPVDYNDNGLQMLTGRRMGYDSPVIRTWRGNHLRCVEGLSLVKDPARNQSTPLCMSNATNPADAGKPKAEPTPKAKALQRLHGALGELISAANSAQGEDGLRPLTEQLAAALVDPTSKINDLLQQSGVEVKPEPAKEAEKPAVEPVKTMSAKPDPLAEFGAEMMTQLGVKTLDEARGKLKALQDNSVALMSAEKKNTGLLLLTALHQGKTDHEEMKLLSEKPAAYVEALLSNRIARVNTRSADEPAPQSGSDAGVDQGFLGGVNAMLSRVTGVKVG